MRIVICCGVACEQILVVVFTNKMTSYVQLSVNDIYTKERY